MMLERVALAKVTEHDSIQSAASKAEVIATSADFLPCDSSVVCLVCLEMFDKTITKKRKVVVALQKLD